MSLFDRTDLRITRGLLLAVAILTPLALVLLRVLQWVAGGSLGWSGPTGRDDVDLGGLLTTAHGARLAWDGDAQVRLPHAPAGLWIATLVPSVLLAAAVVAVALLLRRVVSEIEVGQPFTAVSLRALRVAGLVIVAAAAVLPFVDGAVTSAVMHYAIPDEVSFTVRFSPLWLLGGVLLLALTEAFRAGARLADDVDGLV